MSRDPDDVNKMTESTYKNVMEQFNPGLRNLVNLGKNYEKSVAAMTVAGKAYFDAMTKIGENAAVSPVSRELGVVLVEISEAHRKIHLELEENFKRYHKEIIAELDKKTEMDGKYMNATFRKYQSEHKVKQDFLERSHTDLKKLRRKSQGKNSIKYESKENEYMENITSRQMDMQKFIAEGYREALLEEKRRFCFLVDKHCMFSYQLSTFHDKAKEMLTVKLPTWQEKCSDATKVPESVLSMIEGLSTSVSTTPEPSPHIERHGTNNSAPPPAPQLKPHASPLANMFTQDSPGHNTSTPVPSSNLADQSTVEDSGLSRTVSTASGLELVRRPRVMTIFPHSGGTNDTLLSFQEGELILLLVQEERDGWLYGELEKTGRRGWFPSSYCRLLEQVIANSGIGLQLQEGVDPMNPQADYINPVTARVIQTANSAPSPDSAVSVPNGSSNALFLGGVNPFATVKLRPTVTNDRSAPNV